MYLFYLKPFVKIVGRHHYCSPGKLLLLLWYKILCLSCVVSEDQCININYKLTVGFIWGKACHPGMVPCGIACFQCPSFSCYSVNWHGEHLQFVFHDYGTIHIANLLYLMLKITFNEILKISVLQIYALPPVFTWSYICLRLLNLSYLTLIVINLLYTMASLCKCLNLSKNGKLLKYITEAERDMEFCCLFR